MEKAQFLEHKISFVKTQTGNCFYRVPVFPKELEFLDAGKFDSKKFLVEGAPLEEEIPSRPRLGSLDLIPDYESPWSEDDEDRYIDIKSDLKHQLHFCDISFDKHLERRIVGPELEIIKDRYNVKIAIKEAEDDDKNIHVSCSSRQRVLAAYKEITALVEEQVEKSPPTHFVCFPLASESVMQKVEEFQEEVTKEDFGKKLKDGFMWPSFVHFTLFVLKLSNKARIEKAKRVLTEIASEIYDSLETRSLVFKMKGIDCMTDDPTRTSVIYAKAIETEDAQRRINKICEKLVHLFMEHDMLSPEQHIFDSEAKVHVKLHATLFNSKYDKKSPRFIDASDILKKFENFDFGTVQAKTLALCKIHTKKPGEDFYTIDWKCTLP